MNGKLANLKSFAILTSDNPMGKKLSPSENAANYESLMKDLKLGSFIYFPVKGKYNDIEHSVIIYNISLDDAVYLGDTYNQESIIYCIPDIQNSSVHYEYWERSGEGKPLRRMNILMQQMIKICSLKSVGNSRLEFHSLNRLRKCATSLKNV